MDVKRFVFCFVLVMTFLVVVSSEIKRTGVPLIHNYPRSVYKAGTQNWGMTQNSKGYLYVANNDGLLEFDGQHWQLYAVPNNTIVRSVMAIGDTIFIGAFEQFGYFYPDATGKLVYHSLIPITERKYHNCDEIWKIHSTAEGIVFQSFKYLFTFNKGKISVIEPFSTFGHSFTASGKLFVSDVEKGLFYLMQDALIPVSDDKLFARNEIRCMIPLDANRLLIGFINDGLFVFDGKSLAPWNTKVNEMLKENTVFSGIGLSNGYFAFGSIQNGVYLANNKGEILQHINRYKGLLNNTILSVYEDRQGNLWLGLDNGIDYLEINSPLTIYDYNFHIESTYASIVYNNYLYVGTNQGLFSAPLNSLDNSKNDQADFKLIPGTEGQVWNLHIIDGQLLCGHNFGCFHIQDNKAVRITEERGYWSFTTHMGQSDTIIAGTYAGFSILAREGNSWKKIWKVEDFEESSRSFLQETDTTFWIAHGYRGIFKVELSKDLRKAKNVELYNHVHGLPPELPYNVMRINQEIVFSSKKGFFAFDKDNKVFIPAEKINNIFNDQPAIDNLYPDAGGNLWYFSFGSMGLMRLLEDGKYTQITAPFKRINPMLIESYESVHVFDNRNVFIGSQKGLLHYDPHFKKDYNKRINVFFREINFYGKDSTYKIFEAESLNKPERIMRIPFHLNSVSFRFASPAFDAADHTTFAFRLNGFDKNWSLWDKSTYKEYTNLNEGEYIFEVKVNNLMNSSDLIYSYSFIIEPPFYRSKLAFGIYTAFFILILAGNLFFIHRRIIKTRLREQQKHEKELKEKESAYKEKALEAEKEIVQLRNESLRNEISHKNKELANTTLHLIHKNKILNSIKNQLNSIIDKQSSHSIKPEIDPVISKINKELKSEKFQELFEHYFDDVHQDFISRMKEKHPDLSPRELRLCAYLKMNLSTKEIAPLMNISIRGVEIGRYRLRKKLNLDREDNLINYLMNF